MNRRDTLLNQLAPSPAASQFVYSDEVKAALFNADGTFNQQTAAKVVALESTIISHGMPYPENLQCAQELESIVRAQGAVPATIAIIDGIVQIGLGPQELERLARDGRKCAKCSRRDIPLLIAQKGIGATTVAGTILLASIAGISVMATGGIGGVHRGAESSMDISADLTELGRTPVLVVSAGVKSILDIGRTLEVLETQGVAVMGWKTAEFPAFFTRKSGCPVPSAVQSTEEAAGFVSKMVNLRFTSGGVLAVPIPAEHEANGALIEKAIHTALAEADQQGVKGRDITPFLLKRVNELTKGASLKSNLALVKNNTKVAAGIAFAHFKSYQ